jgi:hypothetical protein
LKRHRETRKLIRVEVEVPTTEDAVAVRRFAQERRRSSAKPKTPASTPQERPVVASEPLEAILLGLTGEALETLRIFAEGLKRAPTPELLARGWRVASNYRDAADMAVRAAEGVEGDYD